MTMEKDCDNWKRLWLKNFMLVIRWNFSSNIDEAIRAVLISLFFFYKKISHVPKAQKAPKSTKNTKKHQKEQKRNQAKAQNTNKQTKNKNALKKHLSGKK